MSLIARNETFITYIENIHGAKHSPLSSWFWWHHIVDSGVSGITEIKFCNDVGRIWLTVYRLFGIDLLVRLVVSVISNKHDMCMEVNIQLV